MVKFTNSHWGIDIKVSDAIHQFKKCASDTSCHLLDEKLAFDVHIDYVVKRLKPRLFFFFSAKKMFLLWS